MLSAISRLNFRRFGNSPSPFEGTGDRIKIISETSDMHFVLTRLAVKEDSLSDVRRSK